MFVNFHEMYKTTKAIRFVAARFPSAWGETKDGLTADR